MPDSSLDVYLHTEPVARLLSAGQGLAALQYSDRAVERFGVGAVALSISLPVRREFYPAYETRAFLDGLLPEGDVRFALAEQLRKDPADTFGLLAEVGRECAGAVTVVPEGAGPPAAEGDVEILDEESLSGRLRELPRAPLGVRSEGSVRLSLAGAQGKLPVVDVGDGRFGMPRDGTPTTHILKPSPPRFPGLAANEATCLEIARRAGLSVPPSHLLDVGEEAVLVVERFDRVRSEAGVTTRRHQEDFAQALGRREKYEADGGPALAEMAALLMAHSAVPVLDLAALAEGVTANVLLGNADAHAKNFSLHLEPAIRLAPLYDLVCTALYESLSTDLALSISGKQAVNQLERSDLVDEFVAWGIGPRAARRIASSTVDAVTTAAEEVAAVEALHDAAPEILRVVRARARQLR